MTQQEFQKYVYIIRMIQMQLGLDQYTDEQSNLILKSIDKASKDVYRKLARKIDINSKDAIGKDRLEDLLAYLNQLTVGVKANLDKTITASLIHASEYVGEEFGKIVSFDGIIDINPMTALSPSQLRSAVSGAIGGASLSSWVNRVFDYPLQESIRKEFLSGMLQGAGYRQIVKEIMDGFNLTKREAITLTRTSIQSANVAAQESVIHANSDIIKGIRWTSVLEPGYKKTGRGTCLRCAALDGTVYKLDAKRPPMPLHPRCRCIWIPETKTFRELDVDMDEMEEANRRYTLRERDYKRIDAGGKRGKIIESEEHVGDYASWFNTRDDQFKLNVLGQKRFELLKSGKVQFKDLVDQKTGWVKTLDELKIVKSSNFINENGILYNSHTPRIDDRKFTEYALNKTHKYGKNKAIVFESALGFNQSNYKKLSDQITESISKYPAEIHKINKDIKTYKVLLPIVGENNKKAIVQTGWIYDVDTNRPRLTTLFVVDQKEQEKYKHLME